MPISPTAPPGPPIFQPFKRPPFGAPKPAIRAVGGLPVAPALIPYSWLQPPLISRTDKPVTSATVSQVVFGSTGTTTYQVDTASQTEYGDNNFTATLYTAQKEDPANLAGWMLTYYATAPGAVPRTRFSKLTIHLSKRTQDERVFLLNELNLGRRIKITDPPATWATGASEQVVEGVHHIFGEIRSVELMTSPIIGASPGVAGPWFRAGSSATGGTHVVPF